MQLADAGLAGAELGCDVFEVPVLAVVVAHDPELPWRQRCESAIDGGIEGELVLDAPLSMRELLLPALAVELPDVGSVQDPQVRMRSARLALQPVLRAQLVEDGAPDALLGEQRSDSGPMAADHLPGTHQRGLLEVLSEDVRRDPAHVGAGERHGHGAQVLRDGAGSGGGHGAQAALRGPMRPRWRR